MSTTVARTERLKPIFQFPRTTVNRPIVPFLSIPLSLRHDPKWTRSQPNFAHDGVSYARETFRRGRAIGGKKYERMARAQRETLRLNGREAAFVDPSDRVRQWNIGPRDKVRLLSGEPEKMFVDPELGPKGGYKIYEVKSIDNKLNRVYLDIPKDASRLGPKPYNWPNMDDREKLEWVVRRDEELRQQTKPDYVPYSKVGLLIQENTEDPSKHIWAKRIQCSAPKRDTELGAWTWNRYGIYRDPVSRVRRIQAIPWPQEPVSYVAPGPTEVAGDVAEAVTLDVKAGADLFEGNAVISQILPIHMRAPPPLSKDRQWVSDTYLTNQEPSEDIRYAYGEDAEGHAAENRLVDLLMPLYLGEELSPRFSSSKKRLAFKHRLSIFAQEKEDYIQRAVDAWEAGGRDRNLRAVLNSPEALLSGVPITPRTLKEVREAAELEYKRIREADMRDASKQIRKGKLWDYVNEGWLDTEKSKRKERKIRRKVEKAKLKLERLDQLKLRERRNQVLPPGLSQNPEDKKLVRGRM
ncbi:hypothetical protein BD324DRAFT_610123 [Kockovaella imperatae]|uniref:Uncharacterized protein n=1 Tax=Kockovaella imperatae TaxID=4999 RepID=A0A1Y1U954_9TREE|nr:hypothetical protein BD324DRAFT_610123 [Kockovaella imperatae]ORX34561.1 hypothetical protein BD324DRAFT_610123 [Kockovaella imperatae]